MTPPEQPQPLVQSQPLDQPQLLDQPQPLGAFGFPAGLLLVAAGSPEVDAARRELVAGRLPAVWPEPLRGHERVHEDDVPGALACFDGSDPVTRYNRWVLDPRSEPADEVRAALPAGYAPLVDVVLSTIGLPTIGLPTVANGELPGQDVDGLPAEVAALVLASRASAAAEHGDGRSAAALLEAGARAAGPQNPALAAVLLGNAGTLLRENGDPDRARSLLVEAADALAGTDLGEVRAELLHQRGSISQEDAARGAGDARELLQEAMQYYYDGLHLVTEQSAPYLWASLQMNLATAHLASPMTQASDQLRLGVATQALRACRRVFTPQEHPGPWSAATVNLANALVYTPSTHQADNLVEAVELYEAVLESGVRDRDQLGRARVLANQGNALAHLGIFDQARAKLVEARYLFESQLDHESATAARSVLDEIAKSEAAAPRDDLAGLADLARQAEQMARMPPSDSAFSSGMGVRISGASTAGDQTGPPPKPTVTVLPAGSAPRRPDQDGGGGR